MPPTIPAELKGQAPPGWRRDKVAPLAWGPFMVELDSGTTVLGGWLWRLDATGLIFFDHDHDHQLTVTAEPVVDGPRIVVQTADWGQLVIRPLTPDEDSLDALQALHLA